MERELLKKILVGVYGEAVAQLGIDELLEDLAEEAELTDDEVAYLRTLLEELAANQKLVVLPHRCKRQHKGGC